MREIVLDTETTGLSPTDGHRVVEIGCLELHHHVPTGATFHTYLNPQRPMPEEAFRVHGLSDAFLADKQLFADIADDFLDFLADAPLVIHNAAFDLAFVNSELGRVNRPSLEPQRAIDTVALARQKFPGARVSLDDLCRRFEIDLSGRDKHGALLDAELLALVYIELTGGRQPGLGLAESAAPAVAAPVLVARARRRHAPTPEEIEAHRALVDSLTDPMWQAYLDRS